MNDAMSPALRQLCQLITGRRTPQTIAPEAWLEIVQAAQAGEVLPLLTWILQQHDFSLPEPLSQAVKTATFQTAAHYALLHHARQQISIALNEAAIPHLWLKGIILAVTVYPAPTLRPMIDLDVLVAYEQRMSALAVLEKIGFLLFKDEHALLNANEQAQKGHVHHFYLRGGVGNIITLEVHFRLLSARNVMLPAEHLAWFRQQAMIVGSMQPPLVGLTPEAHLLYLCAHAVLHHGLSEFVLKRYLDLHFLIQQSTLDWSLVIAQAAELRWTYTVERALMLTQDLFDTAIDSHIVAQLREKRYPDENVAVVDALAGAGAQFEQIWILFVALTWREKIAYGRSIFLPSRAYMRLHYQIPETQHIWSYYLRRWYRQLRQMLSAIRQRMVAKLTTK